MRSKGRRIATLAAASIAVLAVGGCDGGGESSAKRAAPASTLAATPCGTYSGRGCAAASARIDLRSPTFSHPTNITNPLFPISRLRSALLLGHVDGKPFRTETTLLPGTHTVVWNGQPVRVLVSQYTAYLDRRLEEVALDRYAQADDGSVWYFGEDVFDYRRGTIALTEGTWLAGREGPPAMIMPAHPKVGDVYRTENAPGIVFEEVTVEETGRTVTGPRGPVHAAMVAQELHSDGATESKLFAPGYGEFRTGGGGDLEALALAVPTDDARGPLPAALNTLTTGASGMLESARIRDWEAAGATLQTLEAAWRTEQGRSLPPLVAERMAEGVLGLERAVHERNVGTAVQAAIDVSLSSLDLELQYRPPTTIDVGRFYLRTQLLRLDAARHDLGDVAGDVAALEWIRDRIVAAFGPDPLRQVDEGLAALREASDARNLAAAADHAARLGALVRRLAFG